MIPIYDQKENLWIERLLKRSQFDFTEINKSVEEIIANVKKYGDEAVKMYTKTFDGIEIKSFKVSDDQINLAMSEASLDLIKYLKLAMQNIKAYHELQKIEDFEIKKEDGIILGQRVKPIETVGIYVPGGTAAYPSTVLMNAVPAKIAGVKRLIMITPPQKDGTIKASLMVAARLAGVDEIYTVGGAQGIAALTFGTISMPKVDKIVGPGNIYVAIAKKQVSGYVGIDMIAGPSEVLIIADEKANPKYIAADLMAQAEHDKLSAAILLTTSKDIAGSVKDEIEKQIQTLERKSIIEQSLNTLGAIMVLDTLEEAISISNQIAPEHLEILTEDPFEVLKNIENAGSIFLGPYTPEPVGDYFAGPNHTLPTSGTSKFSSALSVLDFVKKSSYTYYTKDALKSASQAIVGLAEEERLTAHKRSIQIRFE
jgi:histidinol dehydrogenase